MAGMLPREELADLAQNGPFPLEIRCHNCGTRYHLYREEISRLAGAAERKKDRKKRDADS
jgi:redox-regulated HSP33 family molecular chaperone